MEVAQDRDAVCLRLRPGTVATFCMRAVLALLDIEVINQAEVLPFFGSITKLVGLNSFEE